MVDVDDELKHELMDAFDDLYTEIEQSLGVLPADPSDDRLNTLFRAIHNIKGHAGMLALHAVTNFTHAMENLAEALRSRRIPVNRDICECLLLGLDRVRDLHHRDVWGRSFADLRETEIQELFNALASATANDIAERTQALLRSLDAGNVFEDADEETLQSMPSCLPLIIPPSSDRQFLDLAFFQELSFQIDAKNPYWIDRSIQLYDWAQKLNRAGGHPVNSHQLAAATYMHDVGMMFVQSDLINNPDKLTEEEHMQVQRHVAWGYDILIRMPTWEEAALIVLSHHERPDGKGYPNRLTSRLIHPGAKILAIVDAFFSMIKGRADRTQRKSIVRAMAEINALSGTQFDAEWVEIFNGMVKEELKNGAL
jgi:HD-GYP domain-containing protein (c-di-GMP phosphodiesterase class II)